MEKYKELIDGIRTYLASGKYTAGINTAVRRNIGNQAKIHTLNCMIAFFSVICCGLPTLAHLWHPRKCAL